MRRPVHVRLLATCVLLGGCEYDLDVGLPWHIDVPRVIGARMVVVEPAPIWDERLGFDADEDALIAEALPGDVVQLQALAVDGEGRPRAPETIDALWFQCIEVDDGFGTSNRCVIDPPRCDSLDEWTTDVACEIGRGGAFEFTFPTLGPWGFVQREVPVLGIIAREIGADAERCRNDILANNPDYASNPDGPLPSAGKFEYEGPACTLAETKLLIGPRWALSFLATDFGFEPAVPIEQIPYLVIYQPSNRVPAPDPPTWLDADTKVPLEGSPPRIRVGQRIATAGPNWRDADSQLYATASQVEDTDSYVFIGRREGLGTFYLGSGPIETFSPSDNSLQFVVAQTQTPSTIRIVMIVGDDRTRDNAGAIGMQVAEFEVVP